MMDVNTVIRAWENFRNSNPYEICSGREFRAIREPEYCMGQMISDTIELLKKLENLEKRHSVLVNACDALLAELKESRKYNEERH